jgi:hypothetical protein
MQIQNRKIKHQSLTLRHQVNHQYTYKTMNKHRKTLMYKEKLLLELV